MDTPSPPRHAITIDVNRKGWRTRRNAILFDADNRSPTDNLPRCFAEDCGGKVKSQFDCGFRLQETFGTKQNARVADVLCRPLEPSRSVGFAVVDWNANRKTPGACRCFWHLVEYEINHGYIVGTGDFLRLALVLSMQCCQIDLPTQREKPESKKPGMRRKFLHTLAARQ